jgi:hypothetical protein
MNDAIYEVTAEDGATLSLDLLPFPGDGLRIVVTDEVQAMVRLSYAQARDLANALIDAGF